MEKLTEYNIPIFGIKEGKHTFNYKIDSTFFALFEESELKNGSLNVELLLDKKPTFLALDFNLNGKLSVGCDRCLDEFDIDIKYETKVFVRYGDETYEESADTMILSRNENELNVAQFILEFIEISVPYRNVHPDHENGDGGCNTNMLDKLDEYEVNEESESDPRWDKLKGLI